LDFVKLDMKDEYAVTVVIASKGYPGPYTKGIEITIGALPDGELRLCVLFRLVD
jgi:phosphoribosylamine--glycine ligase/phosphoribosylformylglycinamidine cyclo-ligase